MNYPVCRDHGAWRYALNHQARGARLGDRWIEYIPLDDIVPAIRNPKRHDLVTLDHSFERFGYTEPSLMDERTGRLVAGHGRLETAIEYRDKGKEPPDGVKVEDGVWSMPVVRGWSSQNDDEANAYLVSSNRTPELGGWDPEELFALLDSIDDLDGTGYVLDDLDRLGIETAMAKQNETKASTSAGDTFKVTVNCMSSVERDELVQNLQEQGFDARAK